MADVPGNGGWTCWQQTWNDFATTAKKRGCRKSDFNFRFGSRNVQIPGKRHSGHVSMSGQHHIVYAWKPIQKFLTECLST